MALDVPGQAPIVFDLGTGLRFWGETQPVDGSFRGTALVTHLHWDHIQGLPFFVPVDRPGAQLDVFGPVQGGGASLGEVFDEFMRPPYFPVRAGDLRGTIAFHEIRDAELSVGEAEVTVRSVPHCGPTNGYRVRWDGATVAYVSDHQSPVDGGQAVSDGVLELCRGADLLIHDAQYTPAEWDQKSHWGHCTVDYAVEVARQAGVGRLVLFHHDPSHGDDTLDRLLAGARASAAGTGIEVLAASEGLTIAMGARTW